jgi:hypothetical protein
MRIMFLRLLPWLIIVLLVGAGVGYFARGYAPTQGVPQPTVEVATPPPTAMLLGGDRDAHGCIPSAGYSWCEAKSKCLRPFEEVCPTPAVTSTPAVDEQQTLIQAVRQALIAKHGPDAGSLTITVSKIQGDYASGGAGSSGGGGMWFAAKAGGVWQLVWDGNGVILCTDLTSYPNFPASLIPECYDAKTNKSITR